MVESGGRVCGGGVVEDRGRDSSRVVRRRYCRDRASDGDVVEAKTSSERVDRTVSCVQSGTIPELGSGEKHCGSGEL
jgi:hypothetical protein